MQKIAESIGEFFVFCVVVFIGLVIVGIVTAAIYFPVLWVIASLLRWVIH